MSPHVECNYDSIRHAGPFGRPPSDRFNLPVAKQIKVSLFPAIRDFILDNKPLFWSIGAASAVLFLVSCLVIPVFIVRIGADYFCESRDESRTIGRTHPGWRRLGLATKNLVGLILLLAGVAMLVLPGQGFLTILMGLVMMDFPGKRGLELRLLRVPGIARAINRLRARFNRPPLRLPSRS